MNKNIFIAIVTIGGLFIIGCSGTEKEVSSKYINYKTKTYLRYPLSGESYIGWGGRTLEQNAHALFKDQRFALDIVALKEGHTVLSAEDIKEDKYETYSGDVSKNESYYIFGREVLATARGVVVSTQNNVVDNTPGEYNQKQAAGNYVVIDHGNGEFSMFGHLKQQSVVVQAGEHVEYGDVLGLCGNSGNSSEAHLHYHLQNTNEWHNGEGLPAQFNAYIANGHLVEKGEPIRGQIIRPSL